MYIRHIDHRSGAPWGPQLREGGIFFRGKAAIFFFPGNGAPWGGSHGGAPWGAPWGAQGGPGAWASRTHGPQGPRPQGPGAPWGTRGGALGDTQNTFLHLVIFVFF